MFKNIQKQLLLKYPLLWNTKFIPMVVIGIVMNLIYFFIGYYDGTIDFTGEYYYGDNDSEVLGFGFLISVIILLLWFWFYSKNNSFKAFYFKSRNALFYEFFQIVVIFILFFNFFIVYKIGVQLHNRSYFSYEEAKKRCEIIGLADIFIDGSFSQTELDSLKMGMIYKDSLKNDSVHEECRLNDRIFNKVDMIFDKKKYYKNSLINRNSRKFEINSYREDSINVKKLKRNIISNKNEILKFLQSYLAIVKEHELHTNLDATTWYNQVVKSPKFTNYKIIFPYTYHVEQQNNKDYYLNHFDYDTYENNFRKDDKYIFDEKYVNENNIKYSKFYVEHYLLHDKYGIISNAYSYRYFRLSELLIFNCMAFMLAVFIFTFRISNLKKWFISIVVFGVLSIAYGIIANLIKNEDVLFPLFAILTFLIFWMYLFFIIRRKKGKSFSEIILNICIWSIPMLLPFIYYFIQELYIDYVYVYKYGVVDPIRKAFKDNVGVMFSANFLISIVLMYFMSKTIRTWKGISEE